MFAFGSITINLFSIIIIVMLFFITIIFNSFKKIYSVILAINCILEVFQLQGFFVAFGTTEVSYQDFWMVVLIFFSIPMLIQEKFDRKLIGLSILMLFSGMVGMVMEIVSPFQGEIMAYDVKGSWDAYIMGTVSKVALRYSMSRFILFFVRIIMYVLTIYIVKTQFILKQLSHLLKSITKVMYIYIYYGLFEFITKFFFGSSIVNNINKIVLGAGTSTYLTLKYRDGFPMLQCFTREPSNYTQALFYITIFLMISKNVHNKLKLRYMIDILAIILIMLISRSFAAIMYIVIIFTAFMILRKKPGRNIQTSMKRANTLVIAGIIIIIAVTIFINISPESYLGDRLINSIESLKRIVNNTWRDYRLTSELTRMVSIYETFKDFLSRPLFGLGLGVEISHGGIVNVLADIGIIGAFAWYKLAFYSTKKGKYDKFFLVLIIIMSNLLIGTSNMIFSSIMIIMIESTSCYVEKEKMGGYGIYESIAY